MEPAIFNLIRAQFAEQERLLLEQGSLQATVFRYPTGVEAVRLINQWGECVILPFQGQQIWSAAFGGPGYAQRELTMRSMFDMPRPTRDFLATFGAFLVHCGITGSGAPGPEDSHELHGELPNAPFLSAYLTLGADERGDFIGVGGRYEHAVAFAHHFAVEPLVKLYADETLANVSLRVTESQTDAHGDDVWCAHQLPPGRFWSHRLFGHAHARTMCGCAPAFPATSRLRQPSQR